MEILASIKGKTLKSFEGEYESERKFFNQFVRLNLGPYAVEIHVGNLAQSRFCSL